MQCNYSKLCQHSRCHPTADYYFGHNRIDMRFSVYGRIGGYKDLMSDCCKRYCDIRHFDKSDEMITPDLSLCQCLGHICEVVVILVLGQS